jgi:transposase-like protein
MHMGRRWSDQELIEAVAGARSWKQVCDRLGLTPGGSTRARLRRRCAELGLDTSHVGVEPAGTYNRTWTDAQLVVAVARAVDLHGVFTELGLRVGGGAWVAMKAHILRLSLDVSHWRPSAREVLFTPPGSRRALPEWTDAEVREAFSGARSVAAVMRRLGLDPLSSRGRRQLERRLRDLGLDPRSLPGKRWAQGSSPDRRASRRPLDEILVQGSTYGSTTHLKRRVLEAGLLVPRCRQCGIDTWQGGPLTLHLDHVNGDRCDHRIENLRLLCPNCHSQTPTYCGRNTVRG